MESFPLIPLNRPFFSLYLLENPAYHSVVLFIILRLTSRVAILKECPFRGFRDGFPPSPLIHLFSFLESGITPPFLGSSTFLAYGSDLDDYPFFPWSWKDLPLFSLLSLGLSQGWNRSTPPLVV